MNQVFLRSDKGEYLPGEIVYGAVYLIIQSPSEAYGIQLSFSGKETVSCEIDVDGNKTSQQVSKDYVDYSNIELFNQKDPFALGSYCFPFRLQLPCLLPGSFSASSCDPEELWSACVRYQLCACVMGSETMLAEQDVVIIEATAEALGANNVTQAQNIDLVPGSFFRKGVNVTIKPLVNYTRSGECSRFRMVVTNQLKVACIFSLKLVRMLTFTIPYRRRRSFEESDDHSEVDLPERNYCSTTLKNGGRTVVREMTGDLSHYVSSMFASGGVLDNIMVPLKSVDGTSVMPSVQGKYVQCDYSLEVSFRLGDNTVHNVSCPMKILPEENAQWMSWKSLSWMDQITSILISETPGPLSPSEQLLGSEGFNRLPGFRIL